MTQRASIAALQRTRQFFVFAAAVEQHGDSTPTQNDLNPDLEITWSLHSPFTHADFVAEPSLCALSGKGVMKNKRPSAAAPARGGRTDKKNRKPEGASRRTAASGAAKDAQAEDTGAQAGSERIAKRLARAGIASRRDAEAMIAEGRVKVNGKVLDTPAFNVSPRDRVEVDDAPLPEVERTRLFLFHKPAGVVTTTRDPEGRSTIFEVLPKGLPRLISVGRLDINTEGLLLLTNDGGLSRVLELPSTGWLRRYRVRVHGQVDQAQLDELQKGIAVDGVFYGSIEATLDRVQGANSWLTVSFREGKNREVKNVLGALGLQVTRLIRVSFGPFQLGDLPEGAVQEVKGRMLRDQLGPRLVEASGADFEAPIAIPFSNRPVRAGEEREEDLTDDKKERAPKGRAPTTRKKTREEYREEGRERLQTKAPRREDGKPARGARPGRPERDGEGRPQRAAAGERPARGRFERDGEGRPPRAAAGDRPARGRFERSEGREERRFDKPRGERGARPERAARPEGGEQGLRRPRPVQGERFSGEGREERRFSRPRNEDGGDRPFRGPRPEGEERASRRPRPLQSERFGGERREGSRFERSEGGDKPFRGRRSEDAGDRGARGDRPAKGGERGRFGSRDEGAGRSGGQGRDREDNNGRSRTAHVWMAPGARPVTKKPEEKPEREGSERRTERSRNGAPRGRSDEGRGGAGGKPRSDRPRNGPGKPRTPGKR